MQNEFMLIDVETEDKKQPYKYSIYGRINKKSEWRWLADFAVRGRAEKYLMELEDGK